MAPRTWRRIVDPDFHTKSFDEIQTFINNASTGGSCGTQTSTGNSAPVVNAGADYTIPRQTPFTLTGSATDPDSDALTYDWEEYDLGAAAPPNNDADGVARPLFRSFSAVTSPARTFPQLSDILNNTSTIGEVLPSINRTMQFRLTARDNKVGGGGVNYDTAAVTVVSAAGPFLVTQPNTNVSWAGSTSQNVLWNIAGTTAAPISCQSVNILLSTDGGITFPTTLAAATINDGGEAVLIPNTPSTTARIKVVCATNIFFDISNTNFSITPAATATATVTGTPPTNTPTLTGTPPTATATPTNTASPTPSSTPLSTATPTSTPTPGPVGGPDAAGYCYRNSTVGGEVFSFTDISTSGTALTLADPDDTIVNGVALPFAFTYYGNSYSTVSVSTNGFLRFNYTGTSTSPANDVVPNAAAPNNILAGYWDDLIFAGATNLRTQTTGTAPNRQFIVQWTDIGLFDFDTAGNLTFQIRLAEGSNDIFYSYYLQGAPPTAPGTVSPEIGGNGATVGIENSTGTIGLLYSFNTARLTNNLQVHFTPSGCFSGSTTPTATPTNTATSTPTVTGTPPTATATVIPPTATVTSTPGAGTCLTEGFETVLPTGWVVQNKSNPVGSTSWFQGSTRLVAQSGSANSYAGANFNNTTGAGNISDWLITPQLTVQNGDVLTFYTSKSLSSGQDFPDRLQVRLSTNGASTNVGVDDTTVGDFTTLLLDINPTLVVGGYPTDWQQFTVTLSGLGGPASGRIAFRYFVTDGGPQGNNSDYIGIDTLTFGCSAASPTATTVATTAVPTTQATTTATTVATMTATTVATTAVPTTQATTTATTVATTAVPTTQATTTATTIATTAVPTTQATTTATTVATTAVPTVQPSATRTATTVATTAVPTAQPSATRTATTVATTAVPTAQPSATRTATTVATTAVPTAQATSTATTVVPGPRLVYLPVVLR